MYSFNNDYSEGAHPRILEAIVKANLTQQAGYGQDDCCRRAAALIKKEADCEGADVHFVTGGTQANLLLAAAALRPYQAVVSADTGHINVHETGAVENTGHKVLPIPCPDGKLTPDLIRQVLEFHKDEHMVQPRMVYISNSTEVGTQYLKSELEVLSSFCRRQGLCLYLDGARLGSALTSARNDLTMTDIARLTDAFTVGGTKNGALFGEALVIVSPQLKPDFRFLIKQRGAMFAKGWLLGIQFEELFRDHLFFDMAIHANSMAEILRKGIASCGYSFAWDSATNQLFPIFPNTLIEDMVSDYLFSVEKKLEDGRSVIRLVTSWATRESEVNGFVEKLMLQKFGR